MNQKQLIILTGTVGGGKSSTALAAAQILRNSGRTPAVIDLDFVYLAGRPSLGFGTAGWHEARHGAGALANSFLRRSHDTVIVEGGFFRGDEFSDVADEVSKATQRTWLTLHVSFEEALRNVEIDPNRGVDAVSRNPEVLRKHYKIFSDALEYLRQHTTVIEAAGRTLEAISDELTDVILSAYPPIGSTG